MGSVVSRCQDALFFRSSLHLLDLPPEVLTVILQFLEGNIRDVLTCSCVCRIFRYLIREIRLDTSGIMESRFLVLVPNVRRVHGLILLDSIEGLERVSERVDGDFQVVFPYHREKGTKRLTTPVYPAMLRDDKEPLIRMEEVTRLTLGVAMMRIEKYPTNLLEIIMGGVLRVRWYKSQCDLCLAVGRGIVTSEALVELVATFLDVVPITSLSYSAFSSINDFKGVTYEVGSPFTQLLFQSKAAQTLETLTLCTNVKGNALPLNSSQRKTLHDLLPQVRTIRFQDPEIPDIPISLSIKKSRFFLKSFRRIIDLPSRFTSNITAIEGLAYLIFPIQGCLRISYDNVLALFPQVRHWRVFIFNIDLTTIFFHRHDLQLQAVIPNNDIPAFLEKHPPSPFVSMSSVSHFRDFWFQHKDSREFAIWYYS